MKKLWHKIKRWVKSVVSDPYKMVRDAKQVIRCVEQIRWALDSGIFQYTVKNIPGQFDDRVLQAVKDALDKVLGVKEALDKLPDHWPSKNDLHSNALSHKVASTAIKDMYQLDEPEADELIQQVFNGRY